MGAILPILIRLGPSLVACLLYASFALVWFCARGAYYPYEWYAIDMLSVRPFSDLQAILMAGDCWRHGVNVYNPNACMHGGVFNYSPFMLHIIPHVSPRHTMAGGLVYALVLIPAFALLPAVTSRAEFAVRVLAVCSSSVIFALETANFDALVCALLLAAVALLNTRRFFMLGYLVFLFAAACKFYPIALMALVLRERLAVVLGLAALGAIGLGLFVVFYSHGLASALAIIPAGLPYRGVFGALNLPFGLMLLNYLPFLTLEPNVPEFFYAVDHPLAPEMMNLGTYVLTVFGLIASVLSAPRLAGPWRNAEPQRGMFFMAGAIAAVFCFYAAQNLEYRAVLLVLLVPGLWSMSRGDRLVKALLVCVLLLLWAECLRHLVYVLGNAAFGPEYAFYPEVIFWLARECTWWWVMIQLGGFIFCFIKQNLARLLNEAFPLPASQHG